MTIDQADKAEPRYLTIQETADQLRCSTDTVRRRIKSRELEAVFFAGQWKITQAAIDRMLEATR
jgi:excisionase family DNA binding protein